MSVEPLFLPNTYAPCPQRGGSRYNPDTLEGAYRGCTIARVLDLTVEAAAGASAEVAQAEGSATGRTGPGADDRAHTWSACPTW